MGGEPGGRGRGEESNEELVREVRKVRDELHDIRRELERIGDALE
jgi:50S ribosomal subunit-associated GTPase HflX